MHDIQRHTYHVECKLKKVLLEFLKTLILTIFLKKDVSFLDISNDYFRQSINETQSQSYWIKN